MIKYCLAIAITLSAMNMSGQEIMIVDETTQKALPFVTISNESKTASTMANDKGKADISIFKDTDLYFSFMGYETLKISYRSILQQGLKVSLKESAISLDEIVISSSKWEQNKREVPQQIISINKKKIEFQNPQTAADLLGLTGDVYIQKSQLGGGSPMIRGFATNRVLLVVDGVRMNNAIFRSGNVQNVISIDANAIESTEILFGPGSVMYGSDAIGGVMDFHTLTPVLSVTDSILFKGGTLARYATVNNEKTAHIDFNIGLKKFAFVTSATFSDFDDLRMGSNGHEEYQRFHYADRINGKDTVMLNPDPDVQVPTAYNQLNLMQKIRFQPNEKWDINYGFHYSQTSDVPRYDRLIEYSGPGKLKSAEWYYGPQKWMMNSLAIQHTDTSRFFDKARLIIAFQDYEESRNDRKFNKTTLRNQAETVDAYSVNLDFDKELNIKSSFFYGAEMLLNQVGSAAQITDIVSGVTAPTNSRYPDGSTWKSLAAYLSYKSNLSEKLTLLCGIRYSHVAIHATFDTTFFKFPFTETNLSNGAVNGSAGVAYRPAESWQINFNLSTGFRSPNIDDIGKIFNPEPGAIVVPNLNIKPEHAYNADFGIAKIFKEILKVDVTTFYTLLNNALVRRDYQFNGQDSIIFDGEMSRVQAIQNSAKAYVWGVQTGIEAKLPFGFSLSSHFNYQKGEEQDEATGEYVSLRHAAPIFGQTHLVYTRKKLRTDFYAIYNGKISYENLTVSERAKPFIYAKDENGNPYSPAWYTLNFKLSYQVNKLLQLNAGVENILDVRYRPYSSGIVAPGRNIIAAVRMKF